MEYDYAVAHILIFIYIITRIYVRAIARLLTLAKGYFLYEAHLSGRADCRRGGAHRSFCGLFDCPYGCFRTIVYVRIAEPPLERGCYLSSPAAGRRLTTK
jgi:hypothetical protein